MPNLNSSSRDFFSYCILSAAYLSRFYRFYAVYTFRFAFRDCLLCFAFYAFYALEDGDVIKNSRPQTQYNLLLSLRHSIPIVVAVAPVVPFVTTCAF